MASSVLRGYGVSNPRGLVTVFRWKGYKIENTGDRGREIKQGRPCLKKMR
jgi:hypothetical protein